MCLEQAPNPFAFSVGNIDRLFKHFLVFFNAGDRSWAISQNVLLSGRDLAVRRRVRQRGHGQSDLGGAGRIAS